VHLVNLKLGIQGLQRQGGGWHWIEEEGGLKVEDQGGRGGIVLVAKIGIDNATIDEI